MTEKRKKILTGIVVSDKMQKTVVVEYVRAFKHKKFNKIIRESKKYKVHDEKEVAKIGNKIEFYEDRPVSKTKYMYLHRIVS